MKYHRKEKENDRVDLFFSSIVDKFHQALFSVDHDDPKIPNVDVYGMFNRAWINYADTHNSKAKKIGVDRDAFYNYAIKRD